LILGAQATLRDARDGVGFAKIPDERQADRTRRFLIAALPCD
jgi:hypothetical protein